MRYPVIPVLERTGRGENIAGEWMNFRHLDYFKKTGQGNSQYEPSPMGEGRQSWISKAKLCPL